MDLIGKINHGLNMVGKAMGAVQDLYGNFRRSDALFTVPIGVLWRNYPYRSDILSNNIGNKHSDVGYGTPIGAVSLIDYTTADKNGLNGCGKKDYSNYIEYMQGVYGDLSFGNWKYEYNLYTPKVDSTVGILRADKIWGEGENETIWCTNIYEQYLKSKEDPSKLCDGEGTNPNNKKTDSKIGYIGAISYGKSVAMSISEVDEDKRVGYLEESIDINNHTFNTSVDDKEKPRQIGGGSIFPYKRRAYNPSRQYFGVRVNDEDRDKQKSSSNPYVGLRKIDKVGDKRNSLYSYAEKENESIFSNKQKFNDFTSYNNGSMFNQYKAFQTIGLVDDVNVVDDLLTKTDKAFQMGVNGQTIIARFHTDKKKSIDKNDMTQTAYSKYGYSHGRNLLRVDHETNKDNGYENPYCRVWTYHHQYHRLVDCIRPFSFENGKEGENRYSVMTEDEASWESFRSSGVKGFDNGGKRLFSYGVKNNYNGLVNFAPTNDQGNAKASPKKCMFSIENLAWKGIGKRGEYDVNGLSKEQQGPFGGRIMWFPPYNLSFSESVTVNFNDSMEIIGRGEKIPIYKNTSRSGSLDFDIIVDHPQIINEWESYGKDTEGGDDSVDNVETSLEQQVLRFFAGCETLDGKQNGDKTIPNNENGDGSQNGERPDGQGNHQTKIEYFVFYPNNYSGVDDGCDKAWQYLANGVWYGDYIEDDTLKEYSNANLPSTFESKYTFEYDNKQIGGYEMWHGAISGSATPTPVVKGGISLDSLSVDDDYEGNPIDMTSDDDLTITIRPYAKVRKYNYGSNNTKKYAWRYRVDERTIHELLRPENYSDSKSYGLNEKGFKSLLSVHKADENDLYSFIEVFKAVGGDMAEGIDETMYDNDRVQTLQTLFKNRKVQRIESTGWASSHGYVKSNNKLGEDRAKTAMGFVEKHVTKITDDFKATVVHHDIGKVNPAESVSEFNPKVYRCAHVTVYFADEEVNGLQEVAKEESSVTNGSEGAKVGSSNVVTGATSVSTVESDSVDKKRNWLYANPSQRKRYDDEYRFFKALEIDKPFLYNKVIDKVRYFSPLYHSVSAEGFNSRLTFLHQCTRQGPTTTASDLQDLKTASNLAFGRAPVCVLRIGDFFYTKIIITSMNITYKDATWDLNHEGIGVMPMLAHVTLQITFLGGSDLTGPINRLQNAVSFNYYANTGVYDNRSDMVVYDDKGEINKINVYNPQLTKK